MSLDTPTTQADELLIGALLRHAFQAVHRRIIRELHEDGFQGIRTPHIAVFQHPGPEQIRPGVLASQAGVTKQSMNRLLRGLEDAGYLVRSDDPAEGRARLVQLTARGLAAQARINSIVGDIEAGWAKELGAYDLELLKNLLRRVTSGTLARGPQDLVEAEALS